jgi:ABC-type transporter Mla MlaB component
VQNKGSSSTEKEIIQLILGASKAKKAMLDSELRNLSQCYNVRGKCTEDEDPPRLPRPRLTISYFATTRSLFINNKIHFYELVFLCAFLMLKRKCSIQLQATARWQIFRFRKVSDSRCVKLLIGFLRTVRVSSSIVVLRSILSRIFEYLSFYYVGIYTY